MPLVVFIGWPMLRYIVLATAMTFFASMRVAKCQNVTSPLAVLSSRSTSKLPYALDMAKSTLGNASSCYSCTAWFDALEQVVWHTSIVTQTLDTVSIVVTQYNNTAVTSMATVSYGFPTSYVTEPAYVSSILANYTFDPEYEPMWLVANLTDGQLDASASIPYPSPYVAAFGVGFLAVDGPCSQCSTLTPEQGLLFPGGPLTTAAGSSTYTTLSISLEDTYYEVAGGPVFQPFEVEGIGSFVHPESAAAWLRNNPYLNSREPNIGRCLFSNVLQGPPVVKIPVSAITGTVTTTVRMTGTAPSQMAAPGSPVTGSMATSTSTVSSQPSVPTTSSVRSPQLPVQTGESKSVSSPFDANPKVSSVTTPSDTPKSQTNPQQAPKPPVTDSEPHISSVPSLDSPQGIPQHASSEGFRPASAVSPRLALSFAGTHFTQDMKSQIALPAGTLTPGGALTVSGTAMSLAPGGSYVIIGTSTQQLAFATPPSSTKTSAIVVGDAMYTAGDDGNYLIDTQILTKGGQVTVSGTPISLAPNGGYAVIGTTTQDLVAPPLSYVPGGSVVSASLANHANLATVAARLAFGGAAYTANPEGDFVIASQTLGQGEILTLSGTPISYATDGKAVIIGSSTQLLFSTTKLRAPTITFGGSQYAANSAGDFVIGSQMLKLGQGLTISGTPVSYAANGKAIVVDSSTQLLCPANKCNAPIITFGGSRYTQDSASDFIMASQTLTPGGSITVSGTPIFYRTGGGGEIVIGSSTHHLTQPVRSDFIVYAGSTYVKDSAGDYIIASQTLTPGGVISVSGTPISYGTISGGDVVTGSSTRGIDTPAKTGFMVYAGSTYKEESGGDFIIAGQTLAPGEVITVSGTPISYASDKTDVVIGTSTETVETGLGGYIISAFGNGPGGPTNTVSATMAAFTGAAGKLSDERLLWTVFMAALITLAAAV